MTKEELQKKIAILEEDNRRLGIQEEELRKDISRVLGNFHTTHERWTNERKTELVVYSWAEIFAEIGKLLAARTFYDLEGNVSEMECAVENINKKLSDWENKLEERL